MKDIKSFILKSVSLIYALLSAVWVVIFLNLVMHYPFPSVYTPFYIVGVLGLIFTAALSIILSFFKKQSPKLKIALLIGIAITILVFVIIPPHNYAVPALMLFGPVVKTKLWSGFLMYLVSRKFFIVIAIILLVLLLIRKTKNNKECVL